MVSKSQKMPHVLVLNGGSSSIKFALYRLGNPPERGLYGKIERIGLSGTTFIFNDPALNEQDNRGIGDFDHTTSANFLLDWLDTRIDLASIAAVGHRIVNGASVYHEPRRVTGEMLDELRRISAYAPEHLPAQIEIIDLIGERIPNLPQIACFDTAFHRDMPRVAKILPIPRRFQTKGVERYGFHGLSYTYLMEELVRAVGTEAALGRVILLHLGNGASLAAVSGGNGINTANSPPMVA